MFSQAKCVHDIDLNPRKDGCYWLQTGASKLTFSRTFGSRKSVGIWEGESEKQEGERVY